MLTLYATIQETPRDNKGGYSLARDELVTEAEEYDEARDQVQRTLPTGWRLIALRVERDTDPD